MSLYYSIKIPENIVQKIGESSKLLCDKSGRDLQLKFEKDKYSPHITFVYFGNTLDNVSVDIKNDIDKLIKNTKLYCFLEFVKISLFGRFVVAEFKSNDELSLIKGKLIKSIIDILQKGGYHTESYNFMDKNNYDGSKFTRVWQPHITIGGIRTPSVDYCYRNGLSLPQDCVNECFKNMKKYIEPALVGMSFNAVELK